MDAFIPNKLYGLNEVNTLFPKIYSVKKTGTTDWDPELFYDPDSKTYFELGPYGRWDVPCFICLDIKDASEWKGVSFREGG